MMAAPTDSNRLDTLKASLPYILGIVLAAALYHTLHQMVQQVHYTDIVHELRTASPLQLTGALLFTGLSFMALMATEIISLRLAGLRLPWLRACAVSFLSQAIVHTTGFGLVLGTTLRYRLYARNQLTLGDVTRAQLFFSSGFGLTIIILLGLVLVIEPDHFVLHVGGQPGWWQGLGAALLFMAGAALGWSVSGKTISLLGRQFTPPSARRSLLLLALTATDLLACAAALYVLLPAALDISYPTLLAAFLAAILVGLVSHVPGGLGVFEAAILLILAPAPELIAATLGALLLFRTLYYLLPFVLASASFATAQLVSWGRQGVWLTSIAPLTSAILTIVVGATLIFSGTTPVEHQRLNQLNEWLTVEMIEASHLLASIIGLVLIVLAYGLRQRLRMALYVALFLSLVGTGLALAKGLEYGTALLLLLNSLLLMAGQAAFYRRGSLLTARPTTGWWIAVAMVLGGALWLLLFSYRHVQYQDELWWQIELNAQASRSLRALLGSALFALLFGLWQLLRPAKARLRLPSAADLDEAAALIARQPTPEGWIALTGDKYLLWNEARTAFLMYGVHGRSWAALGEPIGEASASRELLWQFLELVDDHGGRPAFYQVGSENMIDYIDLGLHPYKLGESALVDLEHFNLQGGKRSSLRASCNKVERAGGHFEIVPAAHVPALLPQIEAVSTAWLDQHNAREKRFSLGSFSADYLSRMPLALVRLDGQIIAFANIWAHLHEKSKTEQFNSTLSIDLMRHTPGAPPGTMDYLMVQTMLYAKQQGYRYFDLGMAPLSGLPAHHLAGNWAQVAQILVNHGERFYNFKGLRQYKEKFSPLWQPKYLMCKPSQLALVLLDISTLISGGLRGLVMK